jgi:hypothetical protein
MTAYSDPWPNAEIGCKMPFWENNRAHSEMVDCARVQGGRRIRTGDIYVIFRGFGSVAQRRNRVQDAVSGWARLAPHAI